MKTFSITCAVLMILLVLYGCDKGESESVWVAASEMQCENVWSCFEGGSTEENVQLYFAEEDVTVLDIVIDNPPEWIFYCNSCDCITGRLINVLIDERDVRRAKRLGFFEKY